MPINSSSNNPLYLTYRNGGQTFALIGPALLIWLIALLGVFSNSFVILVTFRINSLRGTANYLMALICATEVVHQLGHTLFFGIAVSGTNFIDLQLAVWLSLPQHFCSSASFMGIFLASMDRLMAIAAEKFYQKCVSHKRLYLTVLVIIDASYGAICSYFVIKNGNLAAGTPTTGCLAEILPINGDYKFVWIILCAVPLTFSGICYLLIGLIVWCNKSVSNQTSMRLTRSLCIIVCVSIGGYVFNLNAYGVLFFVDFGLSFVAIWHISFIPGAILNLCAACNAPILFINSTEYRKAFIQQLSYFKQNQVVSTSANRFPPQNGQIQESSQSNYQNSQHISSNIDVQNSISNY